MSNGISIKGIVDAGLVVHRFDHEYLDNNPPIPEIDTGLDTGGEAADAKAAGDLAKDLVAPAYSASSTYAVGDLVTYSKKLYRCTTAISTAEAWTAAHWTAVTVSGELGNRDAAISDLKEDLNANLLDHIDVVNPTNWYNKDDFSLGILKANETIQESSSYKYTNYYIPVSPGDVIRFNRGDNFNGLYFRHIAAYDSNKNPLGSSYGIDASIMTFTIPSGVSFVRVTVDVLNNMENLKPMITVGASAPTVYSAYFDPYNVIVTDFVTSETAEQIAKIEGIDESVIALDEIKADTVSKHTTENLFDGVKHLGYVATNGTESVTTEHYHTNKIDVRDLTGKTIKVYNNGAQSSIRFVCAYDKDNNVLSASGSGSLATTYTVPAGVAYIIMSFGINQFNTPYILITTGSGTLYVPKYNRWDVDNYLPVDNAINIPEPFVLLADSLATGKRLVDGWANSVKNRGTYVFSCKLSGEMTADNYIIVGKDGSNGYAVGVSGTQWAWFVNNVNQGGSTHGLTLKDYLVIIVDKLSDGAHVTILTNGGKYTRTNTTFLDEHGSLYVLNSSGITITEVRCTWTSRLFRNRLWLFGDSYVSYSNKRWPYYIYDWGFGENILISGYPGEAAEDGYKDFCAALRGGKPSIAAWLYGMNNPDNGAINSSWLAYTQMFLNVCALYDIQPILATIPCVPSYDNSYKNAWVRASGYRYIDFASAVNTAQDATTWYDNMLYSDNVHPDVQGAIALATQVLTDVPEILVR